MSENQITITINGKSHQFKAGDVDAMRDLPWSERKQLIELLENIKQAEYVKAAKSESDPIEAHTKYESDTKSDASFQNNSTDSTSINHIDLNQASLKSPKNTASTPQLDPSIKASEKDADDVMARLILEQKQHHKPIPDKSSVLKVMLIVFAVIIVLMLIF